MNLLVIGSLNMDFLLYMERLPLPGETVRADEFIRLAGGKGANQAVAAVRSGLSVTMIGCVGDDEIGSLMVSGLKESGVCTTHIINIEETPSGMAFINVSSDGENNIVILPGANAKVTKGVVDTNIEAIQAADAILLQHEIPLETVSYALALAKALGKTTILNPAPAYPLSSETLSLVKILILNEHELSLVTEMKADTKDEIESALRYLRSMGANRIIVTLGENGLLDYFENTIFAHDAYDVAAIDTTAAGDTFIGAFCASLLNGKTREECIDYAQKAAALAVTAKGAQSSIPTKEQIELARI